jgi:hypothetical protein
MPTPAELAKLGDMFNAAVQYSNYIEAGPAPTPPAPTPPSPTPPPAPSGLGVWLNLGGISRYSGAFWFIDIVKQGGDLWDNIPYGDPRMNADYFPAYLKAGQSCSRSLWHGLDAQASDRKITPGEYIVDWDGLGIVDLILAEGITNIRKTVGRIQFTVAETSSVCWVKVAHSPNGPTVNGVDRLRCYRMVNGALLDSGEIFEPDFIDHICLFKDMKGFRTLDWQMGNFGTQSTVDDIVPMSFQSWSRGDRGCPPQVIGKLAAKLEQHLGRVITPWLVTPRMATDPYIRAFLDLVKTAGAKKARLSPVNEFWNWMFPAPKYLLDVYAPLYNIKAVNDAGQPTTAANDVITASYVHMFLRVVKQGDEVFGPANVTYTIDPQTGWQDFGDSWPLQQGGAALPIINTRGHVAYTIYWDMSKVTTPKACIKGLMTPDAMFNAMLECIKDRCTKEILGNIAAYKLKGVTARSTTYECGDHDFWDSSDTRKDQPGDFPVTTIGDFGFTFGDGTDWFNDGEQFIAPNQTMIAPNQGFNWPYRFLVKKMPGGHVQAFLNKAAYVANTPLKVNPGTFKLCPWTRFSVVTKDIRAVLSNTEYGVKLYEAAIALAKAADLEGYGKFAFGGSPADSRFTACFDAENTRFDSPGLSASMAYLATVRP